MNCPPPDAHTEFEDRLHFEVSLAELSARFVGVTSESVGVSAEKTEPLRSWVLNPPRRIQC